LAYCSVEEPTTGAGEEGTFATSEMSRSKSENNPRMVFPFAAGQDNLTKCETVSSLRKTIEKPLAIASILSWDEFQ
jgi:hypothetical protein